MARRKPPRRFPDGLALQLLGDGLPPGGVGRDLRRGRHLRRGRDAQARTGDLPARGEAPGRRAGRVRLRRRPRAQREGRGRRRHGRGQVRQPRAGDRRARGHPRYRAGTRAHTMTAMTDRLSALDVSFLYLESPTTAMHVGGVAVFDADTGKGAGGGGNGSADPDFEFDYQVLCELVSRRISLVPRYRQKVRWVPGHLANPVWVDDEDFDITYHVRRSALPRPGSLDQLRELVGRVQSRQLDRSRPLWEIYLVEGLEDGRFAIITKTHHAVVDGISAIDIGQLILDPTPTPRDIPDDSWVPRQEPSSVGLVTAAVLDTLRRPTQVLDTLRGEVADVRAIGGRVLGAATGL